MQTYLEFEKPIAELEGKIHELRSVGQTEGGVDIFDEIQILDKEIQLLSIGLTNEYE